MSRPDGTTVTVLVHRHGFALFGANGIWLWVWVFCWIRRLVRRDGTWCVTVLTGSPRWFPRYQTVLDEHRAADRPAAHRLAAELMARLEIGAGPG